DQERLGAGADQVDTSWNGVANGLGLVGFGLGFQSKSARTVSVREGASVEISHYIMTLCTLGFSFLKLLAVAASPIVSYILASRFHKTAAMAEQTEKAFLKQPKVFLSSKISGKGKRPGKGGNRFSKNIGLGFKTPREAIQGTYIDRKCPFTGTVSIRGRILAGTCHSAKMQRTIIVRRNYLHFVKKYQRYEKRHSNIPAHVSPCFRVKEGDHVIIGQCRPLSKTVRFNVLKVIPAGASAFAKKAFTGIGPVLNLYLRDHAANEFYRKFTDSLQTPTDLLVTTANTKRIGGRGSSRTSSRCQDYLGLLAQNQDVSAMVNASEVTGQDANHSDCQTKVNRGLASLRCPKCGNVNATEIARLAFLILTFLHRLSFHSKPSALQYMYLSEILAYDKDEKATFVLLGDVGPELTVVSVNYKYSESEDSDYKFTAMRQTITVTKIVSIALLRPLPQAVEIQIMQVMIVTSFLGQV
uniref:Small ribosomal subunit protein uS17 N-terminal domain-containing protein n=1 Tax=Brassica oleracea var. oleracea TaxID=109376 RepID=A0A0D3A9C6_BRAOL